jgi:hypothetical protein
MCEEPCPRDIVDRQLRAYNARDIHAYCSLFAPDAVISNLNDQKEIARGLDAIFATYANRFSSCPNLHCKIKSRIEMGAFVIDHEQVTGLVEDRLVEVIAIYEVRDSLIQTVRFIRT